MTLVDAGRLAGMILMAGVLSFLSGCAEPGAPAPSAAPPSPGSLPPSESAPNASSTGRAIVIVTVHDVVGVEGGALAGVLYEGSEMLEANAIGGFGVEVDSDPFSITESVKEPGPAFRGLFPYVSDEVLAVQPGTHTLILWADDAALMAYGRWAPAQADTGERGMYFCQTTFEVGESDARLSIAGVPPEPDSVGPTLPACTLD